MDLFRKPYYPLQKKELTDSWERLFDRTDLDPIYTEGAVWTLRVEWILDVTR